MAIPTLSDVRAIVVAWWKEPGRPRLDDLKARIAAAWTDPRSSLAISIVDVPIQGLTLVAELRVFDAAGNQVQTITRSWQPAAERPGADLTDVVEDSIDSLTRRERAALAALAGG